MSQYNGSMGCSMDGIHTGSNSIIIHLLYTSYGIQRMKVVITPDNSDDDIISEIMTLTRKLGGELERSTCIDEKSGMKWKKIIITYDLK